MARAEDTEIIDRFEQFYRDYYRNEIGQLAQKYPNEKRSLYVQWGDLYRFDPDIADDFIAQPDQMREYAEEALRLYDLPVDVKLGQAHIRVQGLQQTTGIRDIRARHRGQLIEVTGIIRKATDVRPKVTEAAFECQRCGTLTRIPQTAGEFYEPHECQGCERQGPFEINFDQSEFVDAQKIRVQESPEGLRGGETPQSIDVHIDDDITGHVTAGDHVRVTGILHLDQQGSNQEKSPVFDVYMDGLSVEIEDEQFEDMDITDEDKKRIIELSNESDIYEKMIGSMAPSIYGYEQEKLAIIMQLFSGVTKHLPDGSRTRGDLHMLLIGDPGTGKCVKKSARITLSDGNKRQIGDIVESNLDDPKKIDDGYYDEAEIELPTMHPDGSIHPGRATKVWKREAPDRMYRIETSSGNALEATPSHPLFIPSDGTVRAVRAEDLTEGTFVATTRSVPLAPDGGETMDTSDVVQQPSDSTLSSTDVYRHTSPADGDIAWDRIDSIEAVEPDYEWVYDLEVEGTHSYISNNVISHNSQLLQYVRNLAPRSVYTSGKGSSSAGLCVTGDTTIHTEQGFKPIRELVTSELPDPVSTETAAEKSIGVRTFDRERGEMVDADSSHLWRMPEKPCRRIETQHGKELEASTQTPVLVCGADGIEWRAISEIEAGDHVGVPTDGDSIETVDAELRWDEVVRAEDIGSKEVFDLTVPDTHNFVGNGIVTHNTAAAVRDDFGDGQQWTLEAGALVLADQGIAAVDELDKMRCVTGETEVRTADGRIRPIGELAAEAVTEGTIEPTENGRTVRDIDLDVVTMADDDRLIERPVTAVHEYDAPEELIEVTLESGASVTATPDHPFFVLENDARIERGAADLDAGDTVLIPDSERALRADGGSVSMVPDTPNRSSSVIGCQIKHTRRVENDGQWSSVYDLTVEGTHNFVANGMVVHNSEDRSAMHEALEQQSYHPETEILLSDGRRVDIGEFVDDRMRRNSDRVTDGVDCEILPVHDVGIHSVDLEDNETTKLPIDRVSRHEAPEEFVRVTFSNGREVTVTPEHPMFVDDGGGVGTVEAREIDEGAFVPAPRKLPNSSAPVALDGEPHIGNEKDVRLPTELSGDLAEVLGFLIAEGHSYAGSAHEIGFSNQDERLLERMDRLMASVFGMESSDTTNAAGTVTKRWISTKLYRWFEQNFPEFMHTAREKRIPDRVLGASEEEIRRFLVGAFAGDGGVESEAMAFSTASDGLARDYADALSKIGVGSRIHHHAAENSWKVYVMGDSTERFVEAVVEPADERHDEAMAFVERSNETPRHHDVLPTSAARELRDLKRLLGVGLTGRFRTHLDNGYGVQTETIQRELRALRERADEVETEVRHAETLAELRAAISWSGRQLADRLDGETTSAIHYAENGGYDGERRSDLVDRTREAIHAALNEFDDRAETLDDRCELRYSRVRGVETVPNEGENACEWVYDVTVEPTNTFVSQGVVLHNSISISKAGINATLKSRCSLLGAANPKYGRFDQYEPIGEQIDLEPALISRFDLIFTVTDQPDEEKDADLADHIINTNYAGELHTHRENTTTSNVSEEEVQNVTENVEPTIDAELLRKYIAYAKRNCYPMMSEEAKAQIRDFYVDLRAKGQGEDAPVPVTARKLEALVRLSEASARMRLSDTVEREDAERVIDIVRSCLQDIGVDPETGEFDADVVETGQSKSQRDRAKTLRNIIEELQDEYDDEPGAPVESIIERAEEAGIEESKVEHRLSELKKVGDLYEPQNGYIRSI